MKTGMYLLLTYIERLISTVCFFFYLFLLFRNYMGLVCKFHDLFLKFSGTVSIFIFESVKYCHLRKVRLQISSICLSIFELWSATFTSHFRHVQMFILYCGKNYTVINRKPLFWLVFHIAKLYHLSLYIMQLIIFSYFHLWKIKLQLSYYLFFF